MSINSDMPCKHSWCVLGDTGPHYTTQFINDYIHFTHTLFCYLFFLQWLNQVAVSKIKRIWGHEEQHLLASWEFMDPIVQIYTLFNVV